MKDGFTLRDYQRETLDRLKNNYKEKKQRNLCVAFTGAGKTIMSTEFHNEFKPEEKTLFLVNRIELAHQARESFMESDPTLKVDIEMNTHHADKDADVVVASIDSIGRKGSKRIQKFDPDQFQTVVTDEAHHAVTDIYTRALNYLGVGPDNFLDDKMLVGYTATPNRNDGQGLGGVFDEIPVNYDIRYGIRNGWITDLDVRRIQTKTDISDINAYSNEFNLSELTNKINNPVRNKQILQTYQELCSGEQGIFYCASVEHAYTLTELFKDVGIESFCIEAHTKTDERKGAVSAYKAGKIKVLFNYGTLTYGVNFPETSVIGLCRPVKSTLLLTQIIGRGVRPSQLCFIDAWDGPEARNKRIENSVKPACKVLDFHDMLGDHNIVTIPSLFGLNDELDFSSKDGEKFFKEVVEPLDEVKHETSVDITKIKNLDDVELIVEKHKIDFESLETPEEITRHTNRKWFETGDNEYEIIYPNDKKAIVVRKNQIDKWEVIEHDNDNDMAYKLNDFYDLSAAIKLGDDYATENYDTTFADNREEWESAGVSEKQYNLLRKLYKGGIRVDHREGYDDTGVPVCYYRKTGDRLDAGLASDLIGNKIG